MKLRLRTSFNTSQIEVIGEPVRRTNQTASLFVRALDHQATQAQQAGFEIDEVIADPGSSGVSTRLIDRPQGKRLFDILRSGDVLVVRWVDRLGRNYEDVTGVIREFMVKGVTIRTVINGMTFDGNTDDPIQKAVRDAVIAFMAASAQSQALVTKEAQKAGIEAAMNNEMKYRGRKPSYDRQTYDAIGYGTIPR